MKFRNTAIAMLIFTFGTGFFLENPEDETISYINQVKNNNRPNPKLDLGELPDTSPYIPAKYEALQVSPFSLKDFVHEVSSTGSVELTGRNKDDCKVSPPAEHKQYFLENFELKSLILVGTIEDKIRKGSLVGLIKTPDMGVFEVRQGEYIGMNNGLVGDIRRDYINITEKIRLPGGCWEVKPARMELY